MVTKEIILDKLANDKVWLERGIYAIWKNQTATEKRHEDTEIHNGVGFNGPDGHFMTSLGNQINRKVHGNYGVPFGRCLSEKQVFIARKRMKKYAGQLLRIAKENEERQQFVRETMATIEASNLPENEKRLQKLALIAWNNEKMKEC